MAPRKVTFSLMPTMNSYGYEEQEFQGAVRGTWARFFESIANVQFVEVPWGKPAAVSINVKEIYIGNWQHGRGTTSGNTIWLHNGWVSPGHSPYTSKGFWWVAMNSLEGMQQIVAHELGHHRLMAWGGNRSHCKIPGCTFHVDAGYQWCPVHASKVQQRFWKKKN